jgi:hypothetical protein
MAAQRKYTKEIVFQALHEAEAGATTGHIARTLGVPRGTVAAWLHKHRARSMHQLVALENAKREEKQLAAVSISWPADAQGLHNGLFYKRGAAGRLFYWDGDEWRLSTKQPREIRWAPRSHQRATAGT